MLDETLKLCEDIKNILRQESFNLSKYIGFLVVLETKSFKEKVATIENNVAYCKKIEEWFEENILVFKNEESWTIR